MATLSLVSAQAATVEDLLASLQPNVMPPEPGVWPLAMGYWILIAVMTAALVAGIVVWFRTREWRVVKKHLARIRQLPDPQQQLVQLHQLMRWQLKQTNNASAAMSDREFANFIRQRTGHDEPVWLNQHYSTQVANEINWPEATRLCKTLSNEVTA